MPYIGVRNSGTLWRARLKTMKMWFTGSNVYVLKRVVKTQRGKFCTETMPAAGCEAERAWHLQDTADHSAQLELKMTRGQVRQGQAPEVHSPQNSLNVLWKLYSPISQLKPHMPPVKVKCHFLYEALCISPTQKEPSPPLSAPLNGYLFLSTEHVTSSFVQVLPYLLDIKSLRAIFLPTQHIAQWPVHYDVKTKKLSRFWNYFKHILQLKFCKINKC